MSLERRIRKLEGGYSGAVAAARAAAARLVAGEGSDDDMALISRSRGLKYLSDDELSDAIEMLLERMAAGAASDGEREEYRSKLVEARNERARQQAWRYPTKEADHVQ